MPNRNPRPTRSEYLSAWERAKAEAQRPPVVEEEEESSFFTPVTTALDYLGRPGRATAGFVGAALNDDPDPLGRAWKNLTGERQDDFNQVLKEQGMNEGWARTGLGLAGDIVVDPLNLVGGAAIKGVAKGLGTAAKLPGISHGLDAVTNSGVGKFAGAVKDDLGKKFVPFYGLSKFKDEASGLSYSDSRRLFNSTKEARADAAVRQVLAQLGGDLTPEDAKRISFALDKGEDLSTVQGVEHLAPIQQKAKGLLDTAWDKEVATGLQKPDAKIDNYITYQINQGPHAAHMRRALSGKNRFALPRNLKTLEQVEALGGKTDVREILASRLSASERTLATDDFLRQTTAMFGKKGEALPGYRSVNVPAEAGTKAFMDGVQFPEEIAADLERLYELPKQVGPLRDAFSGSMKLWKGYATRANPGFHMRNIASNVINSWFGGVDFKDVVQRNHEALTWLKNPKAIGKFSPEEIQRALTEYGVTGGHHTAFNELTTMLEQSTKTLGKGKTGKVLSSLNPLNPTNAVLQAGGKVGTALEEMSRKAVFFDQLHKGASLEQAALHVRKYLFDYTELTDFEKGIRDNAMPFYCVPTTATILTRDGWKGHDSLKLNEEVLTYNLERDELEWQPVTGIASFPHDQALLNFSNKHIDLDFTLEHRWPVRVNTTTVNGKVYGGQRKIVHGVDLNTNHSLIMTAEFKDNTASVLTPEQARLLGWLLTDGYWRFRGNYLEAIIYQSPKKFLDEVIAVAGGAPRKPHPDTGVIAVPVLQERLAPLKPYLLRSKDGDWLPLVTRLSREALEALRTAMYRGDGTIKGCNGTDFLAVANPQLRELYRVVEFLRGNRTSDSERGCYVSPRRTVKISAGRLQKRHYSGIVWCPQTPNGTWVMRQGNTITITGNTWARKNLPLQVENLLTQPQKMAAIGKTQHAIEDVSRERGFHVDMKDRPGYLREQGSLQLPWQTDKGANVFSSLMLPHQDLNRLPMGDTQEWLQKDVLASLNPFVKGPIEWAQNKEGFTGQPLFKDPEEPGYTKAHRFAQLAHKLAPGTANKFLGTVESDKGVEIGEGTNYALKQFPLLSVLGRLTTPTNQEEVGRLGGVLSPSNLSFLGASSMGLTDEDLAKSKKFELSRERASQTRKRKEENRVRVPVSKGRFDEATDFLSSLGLLD